MKKQSSKTWIAPLVSLAMLAAMAGANMMRAQPDDADPFHDHVKRVVGAIPNTTGDWVGEDHELPPAAVALLKPNALFNRAYRNKKTGESATLMIVQCKDARDLVGHYPPVCYPAHGWTQSMAESRQWNLQNIPIRGIEYAYEYQKNGGKAQIVIQNFMVLPNGTIVRDMDDVRQFASDYTRHFYGAAQVQLITPSRIDQSRRDAIFTELVGSNAAVIEAMRSGVGG